MLIFIPIIAMSSIPIHKIRTDNSYQKIRIVLKFSNRESRFIGPIISTTGQKKAQAKKIVKLLFWQF